MILRNNASPEGHCRTAAGRPQGPQTRFRGPASPRQALDTKNGHLEPFSALERGGPLQDGCQTRRGGSQTRFRGLASPRQALDSRNGHLEPFPAPGRRGPLQDGRRTWPGGTQTKLGAAGWPKTGFRQPKLPSRAFFGSCKGGALAGPRRDGRRTGSESSGLALDRRRAAEREELLRDPGGTARRCHRRAGLPANCPRCQHFSVFSTQRANPLAPEEAAGQQRRPQRAGFPELPAMLFVFCVFF